jgi:DNA-binding transcriptional LysR family regulator
MHFSDLPPMSTMTSLAVYAECESVQQTADHLGISNAEVQQHFHKIEGHLGVKVFNRDTKPITLTPAGRQLSEYVMAGYFEIIQGVKLANGQDASSQVTLSLPMLMGYDFLVSRMPEFQGSFPLIKVSMTPYTSIQSVNHDVTDVLLVHKKPPLPEYDFEVLGKTQLCLVGARDLVKRYKGRGLNALPLLIAPDTSIGTQWIKDNNFDAVHSGETIPVMEHEMLAHLRAGRGLAVVEKIYVQDAISQGNLIVLKENLDDVTFYLGILQNLIKPTARNLSQWLSARLRPHLAPVQDVTGIY